MKRSMSFLLIALLLSACGGAATETVDEPEVRAEPFLLEVIADDFSFKFAETVPAGPLEIELKNKGMEAHQALIYKLNDGVDYEDYLKAVLEDDAQFPALSRRVGGVNYGVSPGEAETLEEPDPYDSGVYAVVCFIKATESGKNHYELGMISSFTVE